MARPFGLLIFGGALYITEQDYNANRVRRVDMATGKISTVAGSTAPVEGGFSGDGGPAKDALLDTPLGIVADAGGNLFVADIGNKRVRRIDVSSIDRYHPKATLARREMLERMFESGYREFAKLRGQKTDPAFPLFHP